MISLQFISWLWVSCFLSNVRKNPRWHCVIYSCNYQVIYYSKSYISPYPPPPTQRQPHVERISLEAICQTRNRNSPVSLDLDTGRVAYWCLTMARCGESGVCQLRGPVVVKQVPQNHESGVCPASKIHWTNAGLMLVQRRRRWTNINAALLCSLGTSYEGLWWWSMYHRTTPCFFHNVLLPVCPENTSHWTNA